jgi:uncharacterized OsmC-like protein
MDPEMRLILQSENKIRLELRGEQFEIIPEGADISPYHLLAGSMASCTALTVASWAAQAGIDPNTIVVSVTWDMVSERPQRIGRMDMELRWPGLPAERIDTAERAADLCPVHATLRRATEISRRVVAS